MRNQRFIFITCLLAGMCSLAHGQDGSARFDGSVVQLKEFGPGGKHEVSLMGQRLDASFYTTAPMQGWNSHNYFGNIDVTTLSKGSDRRVENGVLATVTSAGEAQNRPLWLQLGNTHPRRVGYITVSAQSHNGSFQMWWSGLSQKTPSISH